MRSPFSPSTFHQPFLPADSRDHLPGILKAGFWICTVIAVAVALHRIFAPLFPVRQGQMSTLDNSFATHRTLTLFHVVPALMFVMLVPLIFSSRFRSRWPSFWKFLERSLFFVGLIVGVTAYFMTADAIGGWVERSAVFLFNSLFLLCLVRAFTVNRSDAHRAWLLRAVAILLGIATTRPVMGVFFATSRITHLTVQQFFGIAFWVGFSINTIAMEWWLRSRKSKALAGDIQQGPIRLPR